MENYISDELKQKAIQILSGKELDWKNIQRVCTDNDPELISYYSVWYNKITMNYWEIDYLYFGVEEKLPVITCMKKVVPKKVTIYESI